jgi:hypothetical protein
MNGLSDLKAVGIENMMICVWDGPQRHVTTIMLRKFVKSCVLSVVGCWTVRETAEECNISIGSGSFKVCPTTSDTGSERRAQ